MERIGQKLTQAGAAVMDAPVTGGAVAVTSIAGNLFDVLPLLGMVLGCVLSSVLIWRNIAITRRDITRDNREAYFRELQIKNLEEKGFKSRES